MELEKHPGITQWYQSDSPPSALGAAQEAYQAAVAFFSTELTKDESKILWLKDKTSMLDVEKAISVAKKTYESKSGKSKARKWLVSCSKRVNYYGTIMDVLVQQHPEYVALAWGSLKLVFVIALNYEALMAEISKTFSRIADVLPRAELHLLLYSTTRMKQDVARIYAYIIKFAQRAVSWYKKNKLEKTIAAVLKPFDIGFKDIVDDISECSRRVDQHASVGMEAEVRDLHIELLQLKSITTTMYAEISQDKKDQKRQFGEYERLQALSAVSTENDPDPQNVLQVCRSIKNRRQAHQNAFQRRWGSPWPSAVNQSLQNWASENRSSMLLGTSSSFVAPAQDLAVDVVDLLRTANVPVIWALPSDSWGNGQCLATDIIRNLVLQAMQINVQPFTSGPHSLSALHVRNATRMKEWIDILFKACTELGQIYIIIDTTAFGQLGKKERDAAISMIGHFHAHVQRSSATRIKVLITDRILTGNSRIPSFDNLRSIPTDRRRSLQKSKVRPCPSRYTFNRTAPTRMLLPAILTADSDCTKDSDESSTSK